MNFKKATVITILALVLVACGSDNDSLDFSNGQTLTEKLACATSPSDRLLVDEFKLQKKKDQIVKKVTLTKVIQVVNINNCNDELVRTERREIVKPIKIVIIQIPEVNFWEGYGFKTARVANRCTDVKLENNNWLTNSAPVLKNNIKFMISVEGNSKDVTLVAKGENFIGYKVYDWDCNEETYKHNRSKCEVKHEGVVQLNVDYKEEVDLVILSEKHCKGKIENV